MVIITITMKCLKCKTEWEQRKENPKSCPACKVRLDVGKWKIKETSQTTEEN